MKGEVLKVYKQSTLLHIQSENSQTLSHTHAKLSKLTIVSVDFFFCEGYKNACISNGVPNEG